MTTTTDLQPGQLVLKGDRSDESALYRFDGWNAARPDHSGRRIADLTWLHNGTRASAWEDTIAPTRAFGLTVLVAIDSWPHEGRLYRITQADETGYVDLVELGGTNRVSTQLVRCRIVGSTTAPFASAIAERYLADRDEQYGI